jgi:hypothetical protein
MNSSHLNWPRLFGRGMTVLLLCSAAAVSGRGESLFPDPNLEAAVRQQVFAKRHNSEPLVEADVVNVSTIDAKHRGITNLAGLEKCRSLAMLDIAGNSVTDLSPLSNLARLQFLDAQSNRISDLKPLASMTALQYLHLADNKVSDISPLAGLTNLASLYLSRNEVECIAPLRRLSRLASLYLDGNRIMDIRPLEGDHRCQPDHSPEAPSLPVPSGQPHRGSRAPGGMGESGYKTGVRALPAVVPRGKSAEDRGRPG